jgi:ATP-dependent Lhr-like helicase
VGQLEGLALPWSELVSAILPARVADFAAESLDALCAEGRVVWVGCGRLGPRDGRVALYRREDAARLLPEDRDGGAWGPLERLILGHLETRGASFLVELESGVLRGSSGATSAEFEAALWDLVWAGQGTNDTVAPLRSLGHVTRAAKGSGRRGVRALAGGRWSLVRNLADPTLTGTERALARAAVLLGRYGIVSREAAEAEDVPGGFGPLYRTLRAMEEAGRVRRGYFVEGFSGAQFAHAGAVDRMRASRSEEEEARSLSAVDPANPYGALLPWPEPCGDPARLRRVPGARVVLVRGTPALYVAPGGRDLLTFRTEADVLESAVHALLQTPLTGRRSPTVERIDGVTVRQSPWAPLLVQLGFTSDYRGLTAPRSGGSGGSRPWAGGRA